MDDSNGSKAFWSWLHTQFFLQYLPRTDVMWIWHQASGKLLDPSGLVIGFGYSGRGVGKNNPESQSLENVGPIPEGYYKIGEPHDSVTHGPFVLALTPDPQNNMHGRKEFLIHGDSVIQPGTASKGCIVLSRSVREDIAKSFDKVLAVVSGDFTPKRDPTEKSA